MLVLLVVLLVPCALVSALVRCDETWSPTALAFASSSALVWRSNAPPRAAAEASVIGARKKERTSPVVTVRQRERERDSVIEAALDAGFGDEARGMCTYALEIRRQMCEFLCVKCCWFLVKGC